jgi:hypothetical protein
MLGYRHFGIQCDLPGVETFEQQIERHDLGQRRRVADTVGAVGLECRAGVRVDDKGGELRTVAFALFLVPRDVGAMPGMARFGGAGSESDRGGRGEQAESTHAQRARGSKGCTKHKLPRPIFCLVHRFVRLNYAQRPATFSCQKRLTASGVFTGMANRIAVLANQLHAHNFSTICREGEQQQNQVRGPEFPKG